MSPGQATNPNPAEGKSPPTVVIPGGTGFVGQYLASCLTGEGYRVVVLSRSRTGEHQGVQYLLWDAETPGAWCSELEGALAVVNLTGRSIDCRPTSKNKQEILDSRIKSVRVLLHACARAARPPRVFVQASSVGYYGNTSLLCTETSPPGEGFLADVSIAWEDAFFGIELEHCRKVVLRLGVVLGKNGGALHRMLPWARAYLGGSHGNGAQQISWIHCDDLVRMILFALRNEKIEGIYNATGIHPVNNRMFMASLRRALRKPWSPPVPAFAIKVSARFVLDTNPDVLLGGVGAVPRRFLSQGFEFRYTRLLQALYHLIRS